MTYHKILPRESFVGLKCVITCILINLDLHIRLRLLTPKHSRIKLFNQFLIWAYRTCSFMYEVCSNDYRTWSKEWSSFHHHFNLIWSSYLDRSLLLYFLSSVKNKTGAKFLLIHKAKIPYNFWTKLLTFQS